MEAAHGAATPLNDKVMLHLVVAEGDGEVDRKLYQAIIGSIMYIVFTMRPNISFTVAVLNR
jgi:hypothetical protein